MRRLLLALAASLAFAGAASAQVSCTGVSGVNSVPQIGVNCNQEPTVATFGGMGYGIVPAASATDIACITGSATKVVRVQQVKVSGTAGTLVTLPVLLNKHTIANTGGTAATTTALPVPVTMDTGVATTASATATLTAYTANPTVDASALQLDAQAASFNTTSALVTGYPAFFDYRERSFSSAPVLRGVAQQLCVNLGGISVSSGLLAVSFVWTEAAQ
jgi:hypothetical protein